MSPNGKQSSMTLLGTRQEPSLVRVSEIADQAAQSLSSIRVPDTYKDGAKMPIKARDMGRLLKQARKSGTTPYDSRNLKNPRLTKDHVEHEVDEARQACHAYGC